ncbi:MAG: ribosome biogenesis factor YjgA [Syntrophobacteraceae bacterium]
MKFSDTNDRGSDELERDPERKSKSQVKREMRELQSMGEQLVSLGSEQLRKIEMPHDLREAVRFARGLKRGEALRRQLQYIGALMREADPEPIQKALEAIGRGQRTDAQLFRRLEHWRDELVAGNDAVQDEILNLYADADRQRLHQLVLNARKETRENKGPKSSRALFRYLRDLAGA